MLLGQQSKEISPLPLGNTQVRLPETESFIAQQLNEKAPEDKVVTEYLLRQLFFDRLGRLSLNQDISFDPTTQIAFLEALQKDMASLWPDQNIELAGEPSETPLLSQYLNELQTDFERLFRFGSRDGYFYLFLSFSYGKVVILYSEVENLPSLDLTDYLSQAG